MISDSPRSHWLIVGISILLVFGIYVQSGWHGYGFDDQLTTQLHPTVSKGVSGIPEIFSSNYIEVGGKKADYRPIAQTTYAIEQSLFGVRPGISHLINVLLYVIVFLLFGSVLQKLTSKKLSPIVAVTILIFSIHPIHTEVVASLKNREEILALFFGLLSWLSMIKYGSSKSWVWPIISSLLFIVALMAKISIAPFALIIPFSLWYFNSTLKRKSIYAAATMIVSTSVYLALVTQLLPWEDRPYQFIEKPLALINDPLEHWSGIISSIGYYLQLTVWPYPMSIYYGYDAIPTSSVFGVICSALAIIGILILTMAGIIKRSTVGFGLAVFLIALVPVSNIFYPIAGTVVERGLFIPSFGSSIAMAGLIHAIVNSKFKPIGLLSVIVLIVGYTCSSAIRVNEWKSLENLLTTDVSNHPKSAKLHQLLGTIYLDKAKALDQEQRVQLAQKAADHFKASLAINDEWAWLNKQLAITYARFIGTPEEAIPYFKRELQLKPNNFNASFNLAKCFSSIGQNDSSLAYTQHTLSINPNHFPSLRQISRSHLLYGDTMVGMHYLNRMFNQYPESDDPYLILADACFKRGDTGRAIMNLDQSVRVNPENDQTLKFLFDFFYSRGEKAKAETYRDIASMN